MTIYHNLPSRESRGFSRTGTLPCPCVLWRYSTGQTRVSVLLNQHIDKPRHASEAVAGRATLPKPWTDSETLQRPVKTYAFGERLMPATPHVEKHFTATAAVRDVVIGMSDGLTVPFALAAGIWGAVASNTHASALVVTAGFAEIAAGSIDMGLGGYLAARTDLEHYASEREREVREIVEMRDLEVEEVVKRSE